MGVKESFEGGPLDGVINAINGRKGRTPNYYTKAGEIMPAADGDRFLREIGVRGIPIVNKNPRISGSCYYMYGKRFDDITGEKTYLYRYATNEV